MEVETGKNKGSDAIGNVKRDLLTGFDKVIVVATDKTALKKVEGKVAKAELLIPTRVEVVLRDGLANAVSS